MAKTEGLVFEGYSPRTPLGAAAPAASLPDMSRYGNNGVFGAGAAAPTWTQLPSGLWVLYFDGGDYISLGVDTFDTLYPGTTYSGTFEVWMRYPTASASRHFLNVEGGWLVYHNPAGQIYAFVTGSSADAAITPTDYDDDIWHHFAFTWDTALQQIFIDGAFIISDVPTALINLSTLSRQTAIGADWRLDRAFYIGYMGLIRFKNYALSADQINRHFAAEKTLFGV